MTLAKAVGKTRRGSSPHAPVDVDTLPADEQIEEGGAASPRCCLTGDALVRTDRGLVRLDGLAALSGADPGAVEAAVDLCVQGAGGRVHHASRWFDSGVHDVIRVTTTGGYSVVASINHPVLTVTWTGAQRWVRVDGLRPGDHLALYVGPALGADPTHDQITAAEAERLGTAVTAGRAMSVPDEVLRGSAEVQRAFVRRLAVVDDQRVHIPLHSHALADQVRTLLLQFGVVVDETLVNDGVHTLVVNGNLAVAWLTGASDRTPTEALPADAPNVVPLEVVSVELAGRRRAYSPRVDHATHAYTANGFVHHNTEERGGDDVVGIFEERRTVCTPRRRFAYSSDDGGDWQ